MGNGLRAKAARNLDVAIVETLEGRTLLAAALAPEYISYRASTGKVLLDTNGDHVADRKWFAGQPGDQLVAGDFDGNTVSDLATYRNGLWSVDLNTNGSIDRQVHFGDAGQTALMGDLQGDGFADFIIYNKASGVWVTDTNHDGLADSTKVPYFTFGGQSGDIPLVGDMNGDGKDDPIIYRAGTWLVDYNRDGKSDLTFKIAGAPIGAPVVVNWGGDYRVRAGVVTNAKWYLDTDDNRSADVSFNYGFDGESPITGFFNTANSIFVRAGAKGTGTLSNPLGKLHDAVLKHQPGQIIRVAAGTYVENVVAWMKDDLTIVGAGRNATKIAPASGDAMAIVLGRNTWLHNLRFSGGGRGLITLGGDIHARYISTLAVKYDGLVANDCLQPEVRAAKLDIAYSNFNSSQRGYGVHLQGSTHADFWKSTFSSNGTASDLIGGEANGRGLVITGNSHATVRQSSLDSNFDNGLSVIGNGSIVMRKSTMRFSKVGNGAMFLDNAKVDIESSVFEHNGRIRDPGKLTDGRNGIEFYFDFHGPSARIVNNTFKNNTGFGIFVANGRGITVAKNVFDNNLVGMGIEGLSGRDIQITIQSNTFQVPVGSYDECGIFLYGPDAEVKLGGSATSLKNTFRNYRAKMAIYVTPYMPEGVYQGYPSMNVLLSDNLYVNSPDPLFYVV